MMKQDTIKLKVIKDYSSHQGTLYKDSIVTVDSMYKSFLNTEKIQVKDNTGKIWFIESKVLEKL